MPYAFAFSDAKGQKKAEIAAVAGQAPDFIFAKEPSHFLYVSLGLC